MKKLGMIAACGLILLTTGCAFVVGNRVAGGVEGLPHSQVSVHDSGDLELKKAGGGLVLTSAEGKKFRVTVSEQGELQVLAAE